MHEALFKLCFSINTLFWSRRCFCVLHQKITPHLLQSPTPSITQNHVMGSQRLPFSSTTGGSSSLRFTSPPVVFRRIKDLNAALFSMRGEEGCEGECNRSTISHKNDCWKFRSELSSAHLLWQALFKLAPGFKLKLIILTDPFLNTHCKPRPL